MSNHIVLAQITDTHCYARDKVRLPWTDLPVFPNRSLQSLLADLPSRCEALLWTGDLVQEETAEAYQRLTAIFADFPKPVYAIPGNHDVPALMAAHLGGQVSLPKHVTLGDWHLFLLSTHCPGQAHGELSDAQLGELASDLAGIPEHQYVAVFMHHHPVSIASEWLDKMGLKQAARFWEVLERFRQVQVVFHGHIHQEFSGAFEFASGRKINVFGTPATCIQVRPRTTTIEFDHTRPAWREIALLSDGTVETRVHYLG